MVMGAQRAETDSQLARSPSSTSDDHDAAGRERRGADPSSLPTVALAG